MDLRITVLTPQLLNAMIADCLAQYPYQGDDSMQITRFKLWAKLKWGIRLQGITIIEITDPVRYSWFLLKYGEKMG